MFNLSFKRDQKQLLSNHFQQRTSEHWKKKIPKDKGYAFTVHDPFEIFGERSGFENFYLVGDNWIEAKDKPIAIAIGFNDWKFGFIADYLPEFRVAFAPRKLSNYKLIGPLKKLVEQPSVAVIWGYNESNNLNRYLRYRGVEIWRVEDGFIRSADLGASGATPYSLVFDKSGLYYNPKSYSGIELILNSYNFDNNSSYVTQSSELLEVIKGSRISKYNPPLTFYNTNLKLKKSVLVIGQVDNDASIRYGNPDGWTMEDMVRLAKYENSDAEILYRPHPEVYKGFQDSNFKNTNVSYFSKVLSPDEHIIELIERVDHIYTITSLTGFEALLRGKKVTVLGKPFYAGWGLTDDRSSFDNVKRARQLTLLQLFFVSYCIYPRYLINFLDDKTGNNDNFYPILSTISKICSDRLELEYRVNDISKLSDELEPALKIRVQLALKNINKCNIKSYKEIFIFFNQYSIDEFILVYMWNELEDKNKLSFLRSISNICNQEYFVKFLYDIYDLGEIDLGSVNQLIACLLPFERNIAENEVYDFFNEHDFINSDEQVVLDKKVCINEDLIKSQFDFFISKSNYPEALDRIKSLMRLSDNTVLKLNYLNLAAKIKYQQFDFHASAGLSLLSMMIDIDKNNRKALTQYIDCKYILESYDISKVMDYILLSIKLNPELISKYRVMTGRDSIWFKVLGSNIYLNKDKSISRLMGLIEHGDYEGSRKLFHDLYDSGKVRADKLLKVYTDFLHTDNRDIEAITILERYLKFNISEFIIKQLIRLYKFTGNFIKAEEYINLCESIGIKLNPTFRLSILQHEGRIGDAYSTYIHEKFTNDLSYALKDRFRNIDCVDDIHAVDQSLILAVYGPGDEIRFMSIYNDIAKMYGSKDFTITCDYRLYEILSRSYESLNFLPIRRTRNFSELYPIEDFDELPSTSLISILDNFSYFKLNEFKKVYVVTDFIGKFRKGYSDFKGNSYLLPNENVVKIFRDRLNKLNPLNKKLVGINWRSSLTNFNRMEHYLDIEHLSPLFENDQVLFVNLQYDDSVEEVNWVQRHYPNKLINLEDIDQLNDLDSVASLMMCLDLVIAPTTSVAELSGAIGVRTWLFSNTSENDWRKINESGTDVWHNSVTIVDVPNKGDKKALVDELYKRLVKFVED
ncbi:hypothetical protein [Psychrobacter sp. HY3-MNA-CIBAN-0198]|uniref:capsular polysaccharide export protein, LipB/KpsS family n=2 Tax=unclassified Psychrobacter TaxID=196806 RepID=UPI00331A0C1F